MPQAQFDEESLLDMAGRVCRSIISKKPFDDESKWANEFKGWSLFVYNYGLRKGLDLARRLKDSEMLRRNQREAYKSFYEVISSVEREISSLAPEALRRLLGYVFWKLTIEEVARGAHKGRSDMPEGRPRGGAGYPRR